MRVITPKIVRGWHLDQFRMDPQPFPGMYPTRWLIEGNWYKTRRHKNAPRVTHRRLFYFGKPNRTVARWLWKIASHPLHGGSAVFREFDQGGLIKQGVTHFPSARLDCEMASHALHGLYYCVGGAPTRMLQGRDSGNWGARKKLVWDGHKILTYDNGAPWDAGTREAITNWLQNTKFVWK